jgi:hypothetical protein
MGNTHAHRGRTAAAILVALLTVLVSAFAAQAALAAHPSDTWKHGNATSCTSCHASISGPGANPGNTLCTQCHTGYVAHTKAGAPAQCWSACHTPGQDMTKVATNDATAGCGVSAAGAGCHGTQGHPGSTPTTCVDCHGAEGQSAHHHAALTDVSVKPVLTAALSAKSIKLRKTFKVSGLAKPVGASYKVTLLIQKKAGTKWVKVTSKTAAPNVTTYKWTLTYKPTKKATYRVVASVPTVPSTTTAGVTAVVRGKLTTKTCVVK